MNPNTEMNEPTISTSANGDLQMVLNSDSVRLYMDRLSTQKYIIIDALQFIRHNGIATRIISWENLHDKIEQLIATTFPPNATTFTANNSIQATSGVPSETITMFQNGASSELIGTDTLNLTSQNDLLLNSITGLIRNLTGCEFNMGGGNITDTATLNGVFDNVLTIQTTGNLGELKLSTQGGTYTTTQKGGGYGGQLVQETPQVGGLVVSNGGLTNSGLYGQFLETTGGAFGFGDFGITNVVSGLNDGRGHSLPFAITTTSVNGSFGSNFNIAQQTIKGNVSFGCRWVVRLGTDNTFLCPYVSFNMNVPPTDVYPDIRYRRLTFQGDNSVPSWVSEGGLGIQVPAVQQNRFLARTTAVIEVSCSAPADSGGLYPGQLSYRIKINGTESNDQLITADVVASTLITAGSSAISFKPGIAFEFVDSIAEITSFEMWSRGMPSGI